MGWIKCYWTKKVNWMVSLSDPLDQDAKFSYSDTGSKSYMWALDWEKSWSSGLVLRIVNHSKQLECVCQDQNWITNLTQLPLTPSLPQPVKVLTYTPADSTFDGPVTSLLSVLNILTEHFSCAKKEREKGAKKILNDFKFGTFVGCFPSDVAASMAVKGLNTLSWFLHILCFQTFQTSTMISEVSCAPPYSGAEWRWAWLTSV